MDPLGFIDGVTLYVYVHNSPPIHRDPLGTDIWIEGGNNTRNPVNNAVHLNLCVDVWPNCGADKPSGRRCFSYAYFIPDCCGRVYEADPVGNWFLSFPRISRRKKTTCQQDQEFLAQIEAVLGNSGFYFLVGRNCRWWVNIWFQAAPGKEQILWCVRYDLDPDTGMSICREWKWVDVGEDVDPVYELPY